MQIAGKNALVLGGAGLVGLAVCRELLARGPACLVVASRQRARAEGAAARLEAEAAGTAARIVPLWGDVFVRAQWQVEGAHPRAAALADPERRRRLVADILDPLDEEMVETSMLACAVEGRAPGFDTPPADIVADCMNTATAVSYQNVYAAARRLAGRARREDEPRALAEEVEGLLASLYVPQLVRHVQLLHEALRRAGTQAYVKVGTSGTGGMGFNIPYTHGEEKPSRLLLSKAALAGAQSLLTFLMARTPGGPRIVKEIKPAAVIGWREIGYGPIRSGGREVPLYDCPPERAVPAKRAESLVEEGDFGLATGETLEGVYIDTGENGQFSAAEFAAITALDQMELVTAEDVARAVVHELRGRSTGRDIVAALDGAVLGPSYRGGLLREAAIEELRRLEARHGAGVAYEVLGPPRLSKLLFEADLLRRAGGTVEAVLGREPAALARDMERTLSDDPAARRRVLSVGLPILLPDGERLLRGPRIKSRTAHHGWVDLTPANVRAWQRRLEAVRAASRGQAEGGAPSCSRDLAAGERWVCADGGFDVGEIVAWIFNTEDGGMRGKG